MREDRAPSPVSQLLVGVALFAVAVAVRGLGWAELHFGADGVQPFDADAYYHLRRVEYALANFPEILGFDPYLNFPDGGRAIWTPVLDFVLAVIARPLVGADAAGLAARLAWVPPLVGGLAVVLTWRVGRRVFGGAEGLAAALFLAILPAHTWYSQVGFIDHHAVVALLAATLLLLQVRLLAREESGSGVRAALALGAGLGGALLVWPGTLLHVAIVESALVVHFAAARPDAAVRGARDLALANAVGAAVVLPLCLGNEWEVWGSFSPVVLSHFQPWLLACAAFACGAPAALWRRGAPPRGAAPRILWVLAAGLLAVALTAPLLPDLLAAPGQVVGWLLRDEAFQSLVGESKPLLFGPRGFDPTIAVARLSGFFVLAPFLIGALLCWPGDRHPAARRSVAWWALVLFLATLAQRRFFNSLSIPFALVVAWGVGAGLRRWVSPRAGGRRLAAAAAATLVGLLLVAPLILSYTADSRALRRQRESVLDVARWLRENTPETSGYLALGGPPEYGLLGSWGDGHALRQLARRPVVVDPFGDDVAPDNFRLAERYFSADHEAAALEIAEALRVRYVVVTPGGAGQRRRYQPRSIFARLYLGLGTLRELGGMRVESLDRHRLVYASGVVVEERPLHLVYEIVPGAVIAGSARPGATVRARVAVAAGGTSFEWIGTARADGDGAFALRVPYASSGPGARAVGSYRLEAGGAAWRVDVPEAAVREGRTLRSPDPGDQGASAGLPARPRATRPDAPEPEQAGRAGAARVPAGRSAAGAS